MLITLKTTMDSEPLLAVRFTPLWMIIQVAVVLSITFAGLCWTIERKQ